MKKNFKGKLTALKVFLLSLVMFLSTSVYGVELLPVNHQESVQAIAESGISPQADDYYATLDENKEGLSFRSDLASLITSTHKTQTTYAGLASAYQTADADPERSGYIIWFYTGTSVKFSGFGSGNGATNREHVWPKSAGNAFPEKSECGSDAHHLRPTEAQLNSTRGSMSFDEVPQTTANIVAENGSKSYKNLCYENGSFFYPGKGYRGATARILMYVQTRWGDKFSLSFVDGAGSVKTIGKISTLMKWHLEEPPTEAEIARNEAVYKIQGNRNPFIDHPEYAEKIYCNDGKSYNTALQKVVDAYGGYEDAEIESVSFENTSISLAKGETATLIPSVTPSNAARKFVWSSSNPSVATVVGGKVTALSKGSTTVTVTAESNPQIKASVTVTVKEATDIAISGAPRKTTYSVGEEFAPGGLSVTATFDDGTTKTLSTSDCQWLDGSTRGSTLSLGSTSVICKYGDIEKMIDGITVIAPVGDEFTISRSSISGSSYAWNEWTANGVKGYVYNYGGNKTEIQLNSSKPSYYFYNTTPLTGGILTITVTMSQSDKDWEILTSSTPFTQVSATPQSGNSHGVKTATGDGVTWTLNTADEYFAINYKGTGAAYVKSVEIRYGATSEPSIPPDVDVEISAQAFKDLVNSLSKQTDPSQIFEGVEKAVQTYAEFTESEKAEVEESYQILKEIVKDYNKFIEGENQTMDTAVNYLLPSLTASFSLVVALIALALKRFI